MISKNVAKYCKDFTKIENYSRAVLDTTQTWECHHKMETHYLKNDKWIERDECISIEKLIEDNLYYNRPPEELIFLTETDHKSLHMKNRAVGPLSEETKRKISETNKIVMQDPVIKAKCGASMRGKHHSEETKKRMSDASKGKPKSEEMKKNLSAAKKGKSTWIKGKTLSDEQKKNMVSVRKRASLLYKEYKASGGTLGWNDWQKLKLF